MLNRPTMRAGRKKKSYVARSFELSCTDGRHMGRQEIGAAQRCSQGDPSISVNTMTCSTLGVFPAASQQARWTWCLQLHRPYPCQVTQSGLEGAMCFLLHAATALLPNTSLLFPFFYSNFAHTNVKQQLFGQHFEKQLVILGCFNFEARVSTPHSKKASFSSPEAVDILTYFLINVNRGSSQTLSGMSVFEASPCRRKMSQCLSEPSYSRLLSLQLNVNKPIMCQSLH